MHVLVIEDEEKLGNYLRKGLAESGFIIDISYDGRDGLAHALTGNYDAVILDVMLPGMNGLDVLTELRKTSRVPVLMLTARDEVEDRVRGLESGADDYLAKPFAFTELLARLRALLRRSPMTEATKYCLADLELDLTTRRAMRAGKRLELTAKEFLLLSLLLRRTGQILSRTVLADQVWGMNFDGETNVVEVAVRRLRSKMDDGHSEKLLHTVRGMGYVMESRKE